VKKNLETICNVVIGTAGHIDHGKTTLVERLTGINPDRLPEEKARGMTIDLGFSRLELPGGLRVGIVDVPGHERFVKNMVAGATGIDLVLLVVAADDGVMPQTREHLAIMSLLDLRHGVIALTKIDLVGADLRGLVLEDLRETLSGTFLESAPVVAVSSATGEGIDDLRQALIRTIGEVAPRDTGGVFRMPIQRVFSSKGFGTVLTGIPVAGQAVAGDMLEVAPLSMSGRVRGIHAYGESTDLARAGHSTAINLTDVDYKEVQRGMVLAAPGFFRPTAMVEARFHCLRRNGRPIDHLTAIRFHAGTAEVLGRIHLLEGKRIEPDQTAYVQFRLDEPVVVAPGDRYVARLASPLETIGGGEVIDRSKWRLKAGKPFVIEALKRKEEAIGSKRLGILQVFTDGGFSALAEKEAAARAGLPEPEARKVLAELQSEGALLRAGRAGLIIARAKLEEAKAAAAATAEDFFRKNPRRLLVPKLHLKDRLRADEAFFHELLAALEAGGLARTVRGDHLQWTGRRPELTPAEARAREELLEAFRAASLSPPAPEEAARAAGLEEALAGALISLLVEEGELLKIAEGLLFHHQALEDARRRLTAHLEKEGSMTAAAARTVLGSTRKYIIPLLEHFDREGLTVRRGDLRELRARG
jgi:selenocysteine-specific elongation factor